MDKKSASKRTAAKAAAAPAELPEDTVFDPPDLGSVIEADFDAPADRPAGLMARVQSVDSPDTVSPHPDLFAARDELIARLGGMAGIASAQAVARPDITGVENIVGVGVGFRFAGKSLSADVVVKVFVEKKLPMAALTQSARIPPELAGIPTDVEDTGKIVPQAWTARQPRPSRCGVSCGHERMATAGTLGFMAILNNNKRVIVSNNHIFALENGAQIGDRIIQPGPMERVPANDEVIGLLEMFVPIQAEGNTVDAAAAGTNNTRVSPTHMTYSVNPTPMQVALGMSVMKNGRTTESTLGMVTDTGFAVRVGYAPFPQGAGFVNQIVVRGVGGSVFSMGGDSGSLVVTAGSKQPVGLLFAGPQDNSVTFINPITEVISKLGIKQFVPG